MIGKGEEFVEVSEHMGHIGRKSLKENVYFASWMSQLCFLTKRGLMNDLREPQSSYARLVMIIIIGLSVMATNWNLPEESTRAITDREGLCFLLTIGVALLAMQHIILICEKPFYIYIYIYSSTREASITKGTDEQFVLLVGLLYSEDNQ